MFEVLFDEAEPGAIEHPAYAPYGQLGFPPPPPERPWIYSNFVQSLDGIVSLKGKHAAGSDISQSREDRWLMDLLRAHADAVLLGVNTLVEETQIGPRARGPVFRIMDPQLRGLRQKLGRRREMNIFVTGSARLNLEDYRVFDGEHVDAVIITTKLGAARLEEKRTHPHVRVIVSGERDIVPLEHAVRVLRREFDVRYLLCEGGPTLYGNLAKAGLIDEKFLTVSPVEVGQIVPPEQEPSEAERADPPRLRPTALNAPGFTNDELVWWKWMSGRRAGDHQFNRYRRVGPSGDPAIGSSGHRAIRSSGDQSWGAGSCGELAGEGSCLELDAPLACPSCATPPFAGPPFPVAKWRRRP
jgi:riboflavin biosynthesis pyrimidine reductase